MNTIAIFGASVPFLPKALAVAIMHAGVDPRSDKGSITTS
jgi:hypothetical protein